MDVDESEAPTTISSRYPNAIDDELFDDKTTDEVGMGPRSGSDGTALKPIVTNDLKAAETITSLKNMIIALSLKLKARYTVENQTKHL